MYLRSSRNSISWARSPTGSRRQSVRLKRSPTQRLVCRYPSEPNVSTLARKPTVARTAANRKRDKLPFPLGGRTLAFTHPEWSADKVRGGEIELRKPWQKIVFMGGLFGALLLLLLADLFWR